MHEIYRDWRALLQTYGPERVLIAEAWVEPLSKMAKWVRPDEMHQAFNFGYLETPWEAAALRAVVDDSIATFGAVGAPEHLGAVQSRRDPASIASCPDPAPAAG